MFVRMLSLKTAVYVGFYLSFFIISVINHTALLRLASAIVKPISGNCVGVSGLGLVVIQSFSQ